MTEQELQQELAATEAPVEAWIIRYTVQYNYSYSKPGSVDRVTHNLTSIHDSEQAARAYMAESFDRIKAIWEAQGLYTIVDMKVCHLVEAPF